MAAPVVDEPSRLEIIIAPIICGLCTSMGPMLIAGTPLPAIIDMNTHPVNYAMFQMLSAVLVMFIGRRHFIGGFKSLYHRAEHGRARRHQL